MKILITGICGFVGYSLARALADHIEGLEICGIDNLSRPGAETNRARLGAAGVKLFHGDLRLASDLEALPAVDWVLEAAAKPSVLAGVDGRVSSRQLLEHNLWSTVNTLEYCRLHTAGLILLSSSRVYSIPALASLPVQPKDDAFALDVSAPLPPGVGPDGLSEAFCVAPPVSLYGATKLASETIALEYGEAFGFPVWVNRCGVLAGAGQFGTAEQGIFSYWLHAHAARRPLRYIGFGGHGWQVRDAFHPDDLAALIAAQIRRPARGGARVWNVGGGIRNAMSLARLTTWCNERFGCFSPAPDLQPRPFDAPWIVMDSAAVREDLGWTPQRSLASILEEIAGHVRDNPDWLDRCGLS